ncbi:MAG: hypothetical protein MK052_06170 [Alphaproteobacteria bacterium]|nr:hypothetical protein [Alphaproteobacteria bacterium]
MVFTSTALAEEGQLADGSSEELPFTWYEPGENPQADAMLPEIMTSMFPRSETSNIYYELSYHAIDLNGDGVDEMIYMFNAWQICPKKECPCGIMQYQNGEVVDIAPPEFYCIGGTYYPEKTKNGYSVIKTKSYFIERSYGQLENEFYWDGKSYASDIPPEAVERLIDY